MRDIPVLTGLDAAALPDELLCSTEPVLLRGLVAHWPVAQAGARSGPEAAAAIRAHWHDATVGMLLGPPEIEGRFFYNEALNGFNFKRETGKLDIVLQALMDLADAPHPPAVYVGSTTVDTCLPTFRAQNDLGLGARDPLVSIWLGNRSRIAAHYDLPDNIACVVAGRRRFTLFPPDQLPNLYVGPLDLTPAGQTISLVDFHRPDLQRFPRFAQALDNAWVAELGPGDAVFIPSMWWHHVESLEAFNVLVNYWWRQSPPFMDAPLTALMLGLLTMRDLPPAQRAAWQQIFQHYVFSPDAQTADHIPPAARTVLGPLDEDTAQRIRLQLLQRLKR